MSSLENKKLRYKMVSKNKRYSIFSIYSLKKRIEY